MLLDFKRLVAQYTIHPNGLLHLGAHFGQEADDYDAANIRRVWWVEANPQLVVPLGQRLSRYPKHKVIQALVYSHDNVELDFHVSNSEAISSSILEFGTHTQFALDTRFVDHIRLMTTTVDTLVSRYDINAEMLVMDLQGAELSALTGATRFLRNVKWIMSEVNEDEVYVNCARVGDLDAFLVDFRRVETSWVPKQGWGDALWIRR